MIVNQWVPAAHRGDAIGDSARRVRDMLRAAGYTSDLYALTMDEGLRGDVRPFADPAARGGDVTFFHFALPSPMTPAFAALKGRRVLQYHNITPASFFAPYDAGLFRLAAIGRQELRSLVGRVDLALGDSDFNRQELEALGFEPTGVLPIAVNTDRIAAGPPRPALERILGDGLINILFVGRIAPNKKIEDHIRLAEIYKRYVDAYYRFIFVGRTESVPRYFAQIQALVIEYQNLSDRFWFTGPVPDEDLAAFYRWADVYVSLSEHEGFCVPLLEAMAADIPVLAYAAGAVPETLGGAGVLFSPKDLELAAETMGMLVYDRQLRQSVIEGQRRRLRDFAAERIEQRLHEVINQVAAGRNSWRLTQSLKHGGHGGHGGSGLIRTTSQMCGGAARRATWIERDPGPRAHERGRGARGTGSLSIHGAGTQCRRATARDVAGNPAASVFSVNSVLKCCGCR
jgi:glycosyltransferase involved in cell wall biosynthesis